MDFENFLNKKNNLKRGVENLDIFSREIVHFSETRLEIIFFVCWARAFLRVPHTLWDGTQLNRWNTINMKLLHENSCEYKGRENNEDACKQH